MLSSLIRFFTGDPKVRNFKRTKPLIDQINAWDEEFGKLSDEELRGKTAEFRERLAQGEQLDDLLPEGFAAVKQACRRLCGKTWAAAGVEITWEMVPFDTQLCGGIYLHWGDIAEMATGEGKTLVASLPLYLNALEGKGAHLVTVNDYLARRDSEWIGPIFGLLGMTVGCILTDMTPEQRRAAYNSDITYGTNNEFGFDYLRDNMAWNADHLVQRGYHYAIVDEVDSVLIDEARTPLIISGQVDRSTHQFDELKPLVYTLVQKQNGLVNTIVAEGEQLLAEAEKLEGRAAEDKRYEAGIKLLQARKGAPKHKRLMKVAGEGAIQRLIDRVEANFMMDKRIPELEADLYFVVDEKGHSIDLTDMGRQTISPGNPDLFLLPDIVAQSSAIEGRTDIDEAERNRLRDEAMSFHEQRTEELHNISQLLRAYILFEKDKDYVVQDNKVIIVDEFTGRMMNGRRWSDGLHQAVEAKEGVTVEKETQTLATITLQNYFRMYAKLSGMTGTAETEAQEFAHTYKMDVAVIPTHRPLRRVDYDDLIYKTQREKFQAIVKEVQRLNENGLPVLVGTTSVDVSELLSKMLQRAKISHSLLNAKQHQREAQIVTQAGQAGAVTIATNMAGRGTDIKLGPGVVKCRHEQHSGPYCSACPNVPAGAKRDPNIPPCGLQIIGSERHEARRIDRQLRGRAGRQGDPGSSRFFVSLEDDLMRLFASERMAAIMGKGFEEGEAMEHPIATRSIANAQKKIEGINFEQRKRTLEYDNVMNKQRSAIYGFRRQALLATDGNADQVLDVTAEALSTVWQEYAVGADNEWDVAGFLEYMRRQVPFINLDDLPEANEANLENFLNAIVDRCEEVYKKKSELFGDELMALLNRFVILNVVDSHWRDHLLAIDELRQGIGLRGYGQVDPLVEYQREATNLFTEMMGTVYREVFERIYRATVVQQQAPEPPPPQRMSFQKEEGRQSVRETVAQQAAQQQAAQQHAAQQAPPDDDDGAGAPPTSADPRHVPYRRSRPKIGPNDPCPCGSGQKYKKCHGALPNRPTMRIDE